MTCRQEQTVSEGWVEETAVVPSGSGTGSLASVRERSMRMRS